MTPHSAAGRQPTDSEPAGVLHRLLGSLDAVARHTARHATRVPTAQTVELLRSAVDIRRLAARYPAPFRTGQLFELMHVMSFNRDAIAHGSRLRAFVVEWMPGGSQNGAVDIRVGLGARVVQNVQAKCGRQANWVASEVAGGRYPGMPILVVDGQVDDVVRSLQRRGAGQPGCFRVPVTHQIQLNGRHSTPVGAGEVVHVAVDPVGWHNRLLAAAATREVVIGAGAAAAAAGVLAGIVTFGGQIPALRSGQVTARRATLAVGSAAGRSAVRAGAAGGLGQALVVVANAGRIPTALGRGVIPYTIAGVGIDLATVVARYARGQLADQQLAAAAASTVTTSALVWAFGTIAQTAFPVPIVGAVLGGTAGHLTARTVTRGITAATTAIREDADGRTRAAGTRTGTELAVRLAETRRETITTVGRRRNDDMRTSVLPLLASTEAAIGSSQPSAAMSSLAQLNAALGGELTLSGVSELDAWMREPRAVLRLNPNPAPNAAGSAIIGDPVAPPGENGL
jgi:hypothetical protein